MSALVEPRQAPQTTSPLRPVPTRQSRLGRLPFMLILAGVLVAGLVGLLMPVSYTHLTLPTIYSV